jgi:hypothetical protein
MSQVLRPANDVNNQGWTPVPAYAQVDEAVVDDSDKVSSPQAPINSILEVGFSAGSDPVSSSNHVVQYRIQKDQPGGAQVNVTVALMQGGTTIATWTHNDLANGWQTFTQTLSGAQADAITNYAALSLRITATQV